VYRRIERARIRNDNMLFAECIDRGRGQNGQTKVKDGKVSESVGVP